MPRLPQRVKFVLAAALVLFVVRRSAPGADSGSTLRSASAALHEANGRKAALLLQPACARCSGGDADPAAAAAECAAAGRLAQHLHRLHAAAGARGHRLPRRLLPRPGSAMAELLASLLPRGPFTLLELGAGARPLGPAVARARADALVVVAHAELSDVRATMAAAGSVGGRLLVCQHDARRSVAAQAEEMYGAGDLVDVLVVGELLKLVRIPSEAHKELPFLRRMGRLLSISKVSLVQLPARAKIRPLMRALPWPTYEKLLNAAAAAVGSAIKIVAKPTSGGGPALFVVELLRNDRVVVPATLRAAAASRQSGRGHAGSRATFQMRWDRAGTPALAAAPSGGGEFEATAGGLQLSSVLDLGLYGQQQRIAVTERFLLTPIAPDMTRLRLVPGGAAYKMLLLPWGPSNAQGVAATTAAARLDLHDGRSLPYATAGKPGLERWVAASMPAFASLVNYRATVSLLGWCGHSVRVFHQGRELSRTLGACVAGSGAPRRCPRIDVPVPCPDGPCQPNYVLCLRRLVRKGCKLEQRRWVC